MPCLRSAVVCFTDRGRCRARSDGLHSAIAAILDNYVRTCYVTYIGLHDTVGANSPVVMHNDPRLYKYTTELYLIDCYYSLVLAS
jgi:hypothetical protein